jgi:hypothetical protein
VRNADVTTRRASLLCPLIRSGRACAVVHSAGRTAGAHSEGAHVRRHYELARRGSRTLCIELGCESPTKLAAGAITSAAAGRIGKVRDATVSRMSLAALGRDHGDLVLPLLEIVPTLLTLAAGEALPELAIA